MSKKNKNATKVAELLGISYTYALHLVREVSDREPATVLSSADLAHACRELKEEKEKSRGSKTTARRRGCLPEGAGRINCTACGATAAADGMGTPIVLKCNPDCPDRMVTSHRYDAGHPRDDSKGCIAAVFKDGEEIGDCGKTEDRHAESEYPLEELNG